MVGGGGRRSRGEGQRWQKKTVQRRGWRWWRWAKMAKGGGPTRRTEVAASAEAMETGVEVAERGRRRGKLGRRLTEEADGAPEVAVDERKQRAATRGGHGLGTLTLALLLRSFVWHADGENVVTER